MECNPDVMEKVCEEGAGLTVEYKRWYVKEKQDKAEIKLGISYAGGEKPIWTVMPWEIK